MGSVNSRWSLIVNIRTLVSLIPHTLALFLKSLPITSSRLGPESKLSLFKYSGLIIDLVQFCVLDSCWEQYVSYHYARECQNDMCHVLAAPNTSGSVVGDQYAQSAIWSYNSNTQELTGKFRPVYSANCDSHNFQRNTSTLTEASHPQYLRSILRTTPCSWLAI
jgi:hypothetical protein